MVKYVGTQQCVLAETLKPLQGAMAEMNKYGNDKLAELDAASTVCVREREREGEGERERGREGERARARESESEREEMNKYSNGKLAELDSASTGGPMVGGLLFLMSEVPL